MLFIVTVAPVIVTVLIHHEVLWRLYRWLRSWGHPRLGFVLAVLAVIFTHVVEIVLFAIGYYALITMGGYGTLAGENYKGVLDIGYFSFVTYTSLGYGDITPVGGLRFVAQMEVLTGLVMVAWSASFFFMFMKEVWRK
jgi:hypothetical protein